MKKNAIVIITDQTNEYYRENDILRCLPINDKNNTSVEFSNNRLDKIKIINKMIEFGKEGRQIFLVNSVAIGRDNITSLEQDLYNYAINNIYPTVPEFKEFMNIAHVLIAEKYDYLNSLNGPYTAIMPQDVMDEYKSSFPKTKFMEYPANFSGYAALEERMAVIQKVFRKMIAEKTKNNNKIQVLEAQIEKLRQR